MVAEQTLMNVVWQATSSAFMLEYFLSNSDENWHALYACYSRQVKHMQKTTEKEQQQHLLPPPALSLTFLSALLRQTCQNQACQVCKITQQA